MTGAGAAAGPLRVWRERDGRLLRFGSGVETTKLAAIVAAVEAVAC